MVRLKAIQDEDKIVPDIGKTSSLWALAIETRTTQADVIVALAREAAGDLPKTAGLGGVKIIADRVRLPRWRLQQQ